MTPPLAVRAAALVVMVLAAAALVLCLAGALGVWLFNEPATRAVLAVVDPVEARLAATETRLHTARAAVTDVRLRIEGVEDSVDGLNAALTDPAALRAALGAAVGGQVAPLLDRLGVDTLARLGDRLAEALESGTPGPTPPPGPTPGTGSAAPLDLGVTGALAAAKDQVATAETALAEYESDVATWHRRVRTVQERVPLWIDMLTLVGSIAFVWLALAHGALFAVALGFYTGDDPLAGLRARLSGPPTGLPAA